MTQYTINKHMLKYVWERYEPSNPLPFSWIVSLTFYYNNGFLVK